MRRSVGLADGWRSARATAMILSRGGLAGRASPGGRAAASVAPIYTPEDALGARERYWGDSVWSGDTAGRSRGAPGRAEPRYFALVVEEDAVALVPDLGRDGGLPRAV